MIRGLVEAVCPDGSLLVLKDVLKEVEDALIGELSRDRLLGAIRDRECGWDAADIAVTPIPVRREDRTYVRVVKVDQVGSPDGVGGGRCFLGDDEDMVQNLNRKDHGGWFVRAVGLGAQNNPPPGSVFNEAWEEAREEFSARCKEKETRPDLCVAEAGFPRMACEGDEGF